MTIVPLDEALETGRFGGKAVQLGAAIRAGLPVPPGLALDVEMVEAIGRGDTAAARRLELLAAAFEGTVAVRSSAVGEDGASTSFAGQHLTVLNVAGPVAVVEAVRAVHASGGADGACAYRRRQGLDGTARMAVVIQRMVDPESAGVLFTRNPLDGRDEIVIEAAWGLGEAVVAGLVTPDLFRLGKDGRLLEVAPGTKDLALRPVPGGGTREEPVPPARATAPVLTPAQLLRLHALARRAEALHGPGLDLEWGFAGDDLWLLQTRAITTVARQALA